MHEVSIIQSAVLMAEGQAKASGARQIHKLRLKVGALSGVVPDALEFAFEMVIRGTMAEGAHLEIEAVPAACWCAGCQSEFECQEFMYECPRCHTLGTEIRRGLELELASMEIS